MGTAKQFLLIPYGWLNAYLLPGLAALYGFSFWSNYVQGIFNAFLSLQASFSLLAIVLLASLILGKITSALCSLIYETWLCRGYKIDMLGVLELNDQENKIIFQNFLDDHFRYYQCLAGLSCVLLFVFISWLWQMASWLDALEIFVVCQLFLVGEFIVVRAALMTYKNCSHCLSKLLQQEAKKKQRELDKQSEVRRYEVRSKKSSNS